MTDSLAAAVAQCPGDLNGPQARLEWLNSLLESHAGETADLIVLPELFQCGYNIGDLVSNRAEPGDGPFADSIARLAQTHGTALLYGFAERQGDILYNAAQCIDKTGAVIGSHRKLLLPPGFEGDHFAPGDGCALFHLGGFSIAILICYDIEFPENLRHVALAGADLVAAPTALAANWGVVSDCLVPARAFENGVFVCYANYSGEENGLRYFGGSCIIAPDGKSLARAGETSGLHSARLDRAAVAAAQARLPYHTDRKKLPWSQG